MKPATARTTARRPAARRPPPRGGGPGPVRVLLWTGLAVAIGLGGGAGLRELWRMAEAPASGGPLRAQAPVEPVLQEEGVGQAPVRMARRTEELPRATGPSLLEPSRPEQVHRATVLTYGLAPRPAVDLEWNTEFPEPPQTPALEAPPPWRPDPEAESRPKPEVEALSPPEAAPQGGTQVVLRGRNLSSPTVMFGMSPAKVLTATAEAVTVVVPAGRPGPVDVVLTNGDGNYAIASAGFRYLD